MRSFLDNNLRRIAHRKRLVIAILLTACLAVSLWAIIASFSGEAKAAAQSARETTPSLGADKSDGANSPNSGASTTDDRGPSMERRPSAEAIPSAPSAPASPVTPNAPFAPLAPAPAMPAVPAAPLESFAPLAPAAPASPLAPPAIAAPTAFRLSYSVVLASDPALKLQAPENLTFANSQKYRFIVTPEKDVYLYLVKEDADGRFSLIHPAPGIVSSVDRLEAAQFHPLPLAGNAWLAVTSPKGSERIHLVASPHRVERMEQMVEKAAEANRRGVAHDSAALKAALEAIEKDASSGYAVNKRTEAERSELTLTGAPADACIMTSIIELKVK
ncbi:MAG: DUF4384 domain-containing protein [Candidatus Sumerlaeota bacterium]|nr:DUF4384 domain-containing protein [Candidatus Sumerlaeota bacterium]